ncbi:MAG: N-acetylmuramoyl-L-alanine amidase, partial [Ruthenibacterium sp.]
QSEFEPQPQRPRPQHPPQHRPVRKTGYRRRRRRTRRLWGLVFLAVLLLLCLLLFSRCLSGRTEQPVTAEPSEFNGTVLAVGDTPLYPLPTAPPYTILLDAGHGGTDVGANGIVKESEMTQRIVEDLQTWLLNDSNYAPVLSHASGENASIGDRADASNAAKAALLVSIHGNYDTAESSYGFECFATPPGRLYHGRALTFAHAVADGMQNAGARLRGTTGVRYAYYVPSGENYRKEMVEESDLSTRSELTFGVIEKVNCPAVLIEQAFVTNANDVQMWCGENGSANAARIYYEAICTYFGTPPISS